MKQKKLQIIFTTKKKKNFHDFLSFYVSHSNFKCEQKKSGNKNVHLKRETKKVLTRIITFLHSKEKNTNEDNNKQTKILEAPVEVNLHI